MNSHVPVPESGFAAGLARSAVLHACLIGLLAAGLAWAVWRLAPASFTALEWLPYDTWLRHRQPASVSSALVLIRRDAESEAVFGTGPWDRALLAKVVSALGRAGATVVGLDVPTLDPSPPSRGGAASDALLLEATAAAGSVVFPLPFRPSGTGDRMPSQPSAPSTEAFSHDAWPTLTENAAGKLRRGTPDAAALPALARQAKGLGHTFAILDADRVLRRLPLYVVVGDRAVPAFGMALAMAYLGGGAGITIEPGCGVTVRDVRRPAGNAGTLTIPIDPQGRVLLPFSPARPGRGFAALPFLALWKAVQTADGERLKEWVEGKLVLFYSEQEPLSHLTPLHVALPDGLLHAHLVNAVLTGSWVRPLPNAWRPVVAIVLAVLAAWSLLGLRGWRGVTAVLGLAAGYLAALAGTLAVAGWVLPFVLPLSALLLASGGATIWLHLTAGRQVRRLEGEMLRVQQELVAVREALVRRESLVEGLEEDLESTRSMEDLRGQLVEAKAQETAMRGRLEELERQLRGLQATSIGPFRLKDEESERLRQECEQQGIITRDPHLLALFQDLKRAARAAIPVLLLGEPGTGKELFARAAHRLSPRAEHPFVPVNMAAISPELFESELFGHVKGSFTGAVGDRKGFFELAHGGTIFLDEIGDLRLEHQGKLLRVLQDKTFYRVGAIRPTGVNVRVIAATNRDLQRGVSEGWFREDLYFRLKGVVLRLPPLRERPADISLVAERLLREAAARAEGPELTLSNEAVEALAAHHWAGNIRELQHCLEQAVALAQGPVLTKADLRLTDRAHSARPDAEPIPIDPTGDPAVLECLRRHEFDMQATARALGWDRSTVTQRLKGMAFRALVEAGGDQTKAALQLAGDPTLLRTVELKLSDYYQHLLQSISGFDSAPAALAACKKRFKNLPDRHFRFVEILITQHFEK